MNKICFYKYFKVLVLLNRNVFLHLHMQSSTSFYCNLKCISLGRALDLQICIYLIYEPFKKGVSITKFIIRYMLL